MQKRDTKKRVEREKEEEMEVRRRGEREERVMRVRKAHLNILQEAGHIKPRHHDQ